MTWSGCAWNWTGSATAPHRQRQRGQVDGDRQTTAARRRGAQGTPGPDTARAWEALEQAIIGKAVELLSGPGGLASFLRRRQLGARLGGPSLPLDIGYSRDDPGRDPQRRHPARPALPVGRRLRPARLGLRGAPSHAQGERRQDQHSRIAFCCAGFTTRWSSTGGAGPSSSTPTAPPPHGTRTRPRSSIATAHPPTGVTPPVPGHRLDLHRGPTASAWAKRGHEQSPQPDQRRLRLPMLRDPARGACPSTSRT